MRETRDAAGTGVQCGLAVGAVLVAMAIFAITPQFREEDKHTNQTMVLDGVRFRLETYTNVVDSSWYLDLYDSDGNALVLGIALAVGLDLLFPYRHLEVPPGILFVSDQSGAPLTDPTLDSFNDEDHVLYYQEAADALA